MDHPVDKLDALLTTLQLRMRYNGVTLRHCLLAELLHVAASAQHKQNN